MLCFGGTKNGMAVGEAILFFNHKLAEDFDYRCKQAGQLASKMRFLSAPWVGILENDAWLKYARHANHCAQLLAELVSDIPGVELMFPVQANGVFLQLLGTGHRRTDRQGLALLHLHRQRRRTLHVLVGHRGRARAGIGGGYSGSDVPLTLVTTHTCVPMVCGKRHTLWEPACRRRRLHGRYKT